MRTAYPAAPAFRQDLQWRFIYSLLLPLFVATEALSRFVARFADEESLSTSARGTLTAEARSQASIATSCALMAKSMLQSSERRRRTERQSRSWSQASTLPAAQGRAR